MFADTGIVHQDAYRPKCFAGLSEQPWQAGNVGHIGCEDSGLSARHSYGLRDGLGCNLILAIVDGDGTARRGQYPRNACTDTAACAGDERMPARAPLLQWHDYSFVFPTAVCACSDFARKRSR